MSSLATAPERHAPGDPGAARAAASQQRPTRDAMLALALAAVLTAIVFVTTGGTELAPNTWTEIVLTLTGVGLAIAVLVLGAPGPRHGLAALLLFVALAALTAISIAWSVQGDNSWLEANRTLSYLAVFGGGIALARLFPERWAALLGGVAVAAVAVSGYALLVKVFPATLDAQGTLGRLRAPFDYWNATGLMAALGLPACLWAGARRAPRRLVRALAPGAIAILITVVVLSYSRSAVLAALVAGVIWFAFVPLRLRGAAVLALGLAGAAVLSGWALSTRALSHDRIPLADRTSAGHTFAVVLVLVLAALVAAGFAAARASERADLAAETRRRIGAALLAGLALAAIAGVGALTLSSRGLTGQVSHVWNSLTSTHDYVGDNPSRLGSLESSRARDWSEGWKVFAHAPARGVGALGYATARTRYTHDQLPVDHAHSYVIQTLADFGLLGLAVNLALLIAWAIAAARTLRVRAGPSSPAFVDEHIGMVTLLCVVAAFGAHSAIDWTWFIPGTAVPSLLCAGWLAGRGPLEQRVGRRTTRLRLTRRPAVTAASAALTAAAILAAWAIWQPLRSSNAQAAAISALDGGDTASAFAQARTAAARDPLSVQPHWLLSALYSRIGDQTAARVQLLKAVSMQPDNYDTWQQLGLFDLQQRQSQRALVALKRARELNLGSLSTQTLINQAAGQAAR
ncbi:MAG: O-antigen ligase family protein [Solirubrobacterales bacterium]|nr:O-antigen ligase family protein [Solirubrobacterales bacterium]